MIERYAEVAERYPDGLAEPDWDCRRLLADRLGERIELVEDDILRQPSDDY